MSHPASIPRRFNGWQRLWVVASAFAAVCIASVLVLVWPTDAGRLEERAVYAVELGLKAIAIKAERAGNEVDEFKARKALEQGPQVVRRETYGDMSATELVQKLQPVLQDTEYASLFETRMVADSAHLFQERRQYAVVALAIWLGAITVLYLVGWSVAWVRRGFSNEA